MWVDVAQGKIHMLFFLQVRTQCFVLPLFNLSFFFFSHELVSGRIERLNEEVKEVKSSRSEVLSEKKKLQEKMGDLQKVGLSISLRNETMKVKRGSKITFLMV